MGVDGRSALETAIKEIWLREGDRNTGFFHRMANATERGLVLKQISLQKRKLLSSLSEAEIYAALMGMNGDKAPGPDGFTVAFWQNCWEIVKEDVLDMGGRGLGDYRPISLLGGLYKLLAKVLANRLKKIIDKVISPDQNAFIKGRQILDGSLIANEGVHYGCRIWKGRGQPVNITHLLFADDTIVFCEAKKESLLYLSWILLWFEAASGLKINLEKSMVIPVGEVEGALDMAAEIGCKVGQLPTVYLGLPLGAPNRASSVWDGVEEKMRRKLALWKRQFLSKGGRITLIKSTLASIPLYQMSLFRMPKSVARRLEKLQRNFLWGGANGGIRLI
ncbi:hypothetical protein CK203_020538 [Vitis vinifera]|uniref:Uncharacterized protein n=1 Tax=Vitis vinifera TaxID=29760 RepID=A0A438FMB7_VITVI|nr:hypothetical protein CK203_020538 [Vitis vinifera]